MKIVIILAVVGALTSGTIVYFKDNENSSLKTSQPAEVPQPPKPLTLKDKCSNKFKMILTKIYEKDLAFIDHTVDGRGKSTFVRRYSAEAENWDDDFSEKFYREHLFFAKHLKNKLNEIKFIKELKATEVVFRDSKNKLSAEAILYEWEILAPESIEIFGDGSPHKMQFVVYESTIYWVPFGW